MILIIKTNKERLHDLEFVKPVFDVVKNSLNNKNTKIFVKHYSKLTSKDINKTDKIIICGTSLKDNQFLEDINKFEWIENFKKPLLGICAGSHIIGIVLGYKVRKKMQIGLKNIQINNFLGMKERRQVYHLHNYQVLPEIFHKENIYAVLFHPEVRNKELIVNFYKS
ncbi:hypothetical protein COU59_03355 [Candidatus Pacearchaeota archaeon CG10_big_fil_rev_8_21_14_0_10_34_12]|nr:MAG: hypothetical protein COU59_03355 [Candidatus Pacearchaeota archaeon CG10_big_fil_rev_8_21_14_0_10_34_12]